MQWCLFNYCWFFSMVFNNQYNTDEIFFCFFFFCYWDIDFSRICFETKHETLILILRIFSLNIMLRWFSGATKSFWIHVLFTQGLNHNLPSYTDEAKLIENLSWKNSRLFLNMLFSKSNKSNKMFFLSKL